MEEGYKSFEELAVWQRARELKNEIFELVKTFPKEEKYRLVDQLIRSSRSVNSQISEGHGRRTFPERLNFCIQGRGSLSETLNHLIDANDCKYISAEQLLYYRKRIARVEVPLNGYIKWLESKIQNKK
jgi:four helix bundle protein